MPRFKLHFDYNRLKRGFMFTRLKELEHLQNLIDRYKLPIVREHLLAEVNTPKKNYPIIGLCVGSEKPEAPTLVLIGGVHGLEKIGSQVIIAYLSTLFHQLTWDEHLLKAFEDVRIVSIPILNPAGMARNSRSNPNGVDLMRNAPVESHDPSTHRLVSGHRLGPHLPWYRGPIDSPMELESQTLVKFVTEQALHSKFCLAIDFHSGFGMRDRLWYPYAKTKSKFPKIAEVLGLKDLLDQTYPHHIYKIEPQSDSYTTHGDLWDYLFELHEEDERFRENLFIPWTLEMGSWMWIKKNPFQIFNPLGLFHPIKEHRFDRVMRRHILLIDFFLRAVRSPKSWTGKK